MAAVNGLFDDMQRKQEAIDKEHLATEGAVQSLRANCDVSAVLGSAITGDAKTFGAALENSERNLRNVATGLPAVAARKKFTKQVKVPFPRKQPDASLSTSLTGDEVLIEIARLAGQSADAIAAIREGKGSTEELTVIVRNSGDISQLILAFYTNVSS
jgi:hypothetical protein